MAVIVPDAPGSSGLIGTIDQDQPDVLADGLGLMVENHRQEHGNDGHHSYRADQTAARAFSELQFFFANRFRHHQFWLATHTYFIVSEAFAI